MKLLSSPFSFKGKGYLGKIYRPYVKINITSPKIDEWIPVEILVDTGADYTLLPEQYSQFLKIDLKKDCRLEKTHGVGGQETVYLCKDKVMVKIGKWQKTVPVGILERNDVPALLGRLAALEMLTLVMENRLTLIEVYEENN